MTKISNLASRSFTITKSICSEKIGVIYYDRIIHGFTQRGKGGGERAVWNSKILHHCRAVMAVDCTKRNMQGKKT